MPIRPLPRERSLSDGGTACDRLLAIDGANIHSRPQAVLRQRPLLGNLAGGYDVEVESGNPAAAANGLLEVLNASHDRP